ncbi:multidrug efflux SMR transporter [Paucisalibacillus sp. EB02]|uniref:DMT family transporter n=1 Tax=Paucisalibacillus sp. EB02 TaxID=1347087 RepID=UPI0004B71F0B|nr:multidrug efflux SMR transporter [Paucisalibacillus sp. EB02]
MHWLLLFLAILAEVGGTISMKLSSGFSKVGPSIMLLVFYLLSLSLLNFALKGIEVSVAYAIWSGVGTALVVIIGIFFFSDNLSVVRVISIILIILGVIGLNLGEQQQYSNNTLSEQRDMV